MNTYICLENIRSLYNIGAIFRTCSFYGFYNVILLGYSGKTHDEKGESIMHPEILKTSLGSEKDLNIIMLNNTKDLVDFATKNSLEIISLEQTPKSQDIHLFTEGFENKIVVFGNEATGVTQELINNSKIILELPKDRKSVV